MSEYSIQPLAPQSSMIPAVTPRPSRSSISSTFPLSQVSLVSQLRRTSESATHPGPASTSSAKLALPQSPSSSIPSLRSIRNLLPFAPSKTSNPLPSPAHTSKPSFVNFGSLRRIGHDRKSSSSQIRTQEPEHGPVIAISQSRQTFEEDMMARKRSCDINRSTSDLVASSLSSEEPYVLPLLSPVPPLGADLSTIIEAENSGISKHLPHLEDRTHEDRDNDLPASPFNLEQSDTSRLPSPDSRAASALDLSTSRLAAEVMNALKVEDATSAGEWLKGVNGIVVEAVDDSNVLLPTSIEGIGGNGDIDLGTLDPDLAELLSPNRIHDKTRSPNITSTRIPSRTHSRSPSHPISISRLPNSDGTPPRISPHPVTAVLPSPSSAIMQSSPTGRSASLSRVDPIRGPPSSLPRLMRSATHSVPSTNNSSDGTSSGLRGPPKKRHQPPSPLSSQAQSSQVPSPVSSRGSAGMPPRRPAGFRLATPNRHVSSYARGNPHRTNQPPIPLSSTNQMPPSQFSPRSASDPTQQPSSRPSLELGGTLEVSKRRRPHLFYNRRRSMSVEDARLSPTSGSMSPIRPSSSLSNRPPAMEWLGPRTVKAFAAAGLLDGDRDGANVHALGTGRYASLRAHGEREDRFVPSRMAFSEAASSSSWGRGGSVSRGVTPSESGVTWSSPTFSAPRTTFSGSTAPTSVSASSSSQQAAIQLMKERHDLETEALLSALSDSQRTTKTLRQENLQLRDRIRELEDELNEMRTQIHRFASGVLPPRAPPPAAFSRSPHDRPPLLPCPLADPRRATHRSLSRAHPNRLATSSMDHSPRSSRTASPSRDHDASVPVVLAAPRPRRRCASTTSSVFPSVPPNMSLLMLEDAVHDRLGASSAPPSPPSPTRGVLPHSDLYNVSYNSGGSSQAAHPSVQYTHARHSSSFSSGTGNIHISPTIASFSMTEIPGSPSSLQLRPEHEMHLGDMASLSLYAMSDEEL